MMCPGRAVRITLEVTNNYNKAMQLKEFTSANLRFVNPGSQRLSPMSIQAIMKPPFSGYHVRLTVGKFASGTVGQAAIQWTIDGTFKSQSKRIFA
jgi:hypothetical protein